MEVIMFSGYKESDFGVNELRMLRACGINDSFLFNNGPIRALNSAALDAFGKNSTGPHIDALRRAFKHIMFDGKYRNNDEYEKLCEF